MNGWVNALLIVAVFCVTAVVVAVVFFVLGRIVFRIWDYLDELLSRWGL